LDAFSRSWVVLAVGWPFAAIANYLRDKKALEKRAEEERQREQDWRALLADLERRHPTLLGPDTIWGNEGGTSGSRGDAAE
jgi:hypothetical protein